MPRLLRIALAAIVGATSVWSADRITMRVDLSRTVALTGQRHSQAVPGNDVGAADPTAELNYVTLLLTPAPGLDAFLAELQNPGSPNFHHWLTPEQFGDRFGLSSGDIGKLTAWLQGEGLQVHDVARGRHWITFSGPVAALSRAFHTEFHRYAVKGEIHIANASDPSVPEAFAGVIAGFSGLNDFRPEPLVVEAGTQYTSGSGNHYLGPEDFAVIYDLNPLYFEQNIDGTGISIAVAGESDIDLDDIRQFRQSFGLAPQDPQVILYGPDPGHNSAETEADLDVEWSGAVARGANIVYVNSANPFTAAEYAIDQNLAPILTFSFGACEQDSLTLRSVAQQANAQGITWMAAAGDSGAATCDELYAPTPQASLGPTASFPASLPEVTGVGGTEFADTTGTYWGNNNAVDASALSYIPETVWNSNSTSTLKDAAGGAPSQFFAKPWCQVGTPSDGARDVPDISLSASTQDAYLIVTTASREANSFAAVGGTSATSPSFAGVVAMLNQYLLKQGALSRPGLGNLNPALYRLAQSSSDVFHDVTTGNNRVPCVQGSPQCVDGWLGYSAGPGYDLATGLGSMDFGRLFAEWNDGAVSQTALSASPSSVDLDSTVSLTATVTGGGQTPTGTVTFVSGQTTLGSAALVGSAGGSSASAAITVAASTAVLAPVYALYSGDAIYGSSSGSTTVTLNSAAGHSAVVAYATPNPVPQSARGYWQFTLVLQEAGGVATTLTGVSQNGVAINPGFLGATNIAANGGLAGSITLSPASTPAPYVYVFTGQDADGTTWTRQITVTFSGPAGTYAAPAISLTSIPAAVQQNPNADPSCQWQQDFILAEHGGFLVELTKFTVGAADFSSQIQQIFGTTSLAPYGMLHGSMCWASTNTFAPSSKTFTITATAPAGFTTSSSTTVQYQVAAASPAQFSVEPAQIELTASNAAGSDGLFSAANLIFTGGTGGWQAAILPANSTTSWLKPTTALTGNGSGQLGVTADTTGLSPGAYRAEIAITAAGAIPDHLLIPVTLVVGESATARITAVANAASYSAAAAPGMLAAVFGYNLSSSDVRAQSIPLPLVLGSVSATVNGISAPIVGTFPDSNQINIQIPYEAGTGPAILAINTNGEVADYPFQISIAAPGLFGIWSPSGQFLSSVQQGQPVVAYITGEGDVAPFLATGTTPSSATAVRSLPKPLQSLSVSVGGVAASTPAFVGIPSGAVGATQINFTIPPNAPPGVQPVVVTVGGVASNALSIDVVPAGGP